MKTKNIVFLTTFGLFTLEAMFHYNIGANGKEEDGKLDFHLPNKEQWVKLLVTVGVFSYINSVVVNKMLK